MSRPGTGRAAGLIIADMIDLAAWRQSRDAIARELGRAHSHIDILESTGRNDPMLPRA
jgi:hypothetical protein